MGNGYFHLVNHQNGYAIKLVPPTEGGKGIQIEDLFDYLIDRHIYCDPDELQSAAVLGKETVIYIGDHPCPNENESFSLNISEDHMEATVRFYPPSGNGKRLEKESFIKELEYKKIVYGIQTDMLDKHIAKGIFNTDLVIAKGTKPRHGENARIEYYFNTDNRIRPTMLEDGTVDFFNLNILNNCKEGELLARLFPEDLGEPGTNINGGKVKQRDVRKLVLKFGPNIEISEDKLTLTSKVNGHVSLVDDKVFVANVYEVEHVNNATGNIDFEGDVTVRGNVLSNFKVMAKGSVMINGVVESAHVECGGDIIIGSGMNGMGKGTLKAEGNIVAKFLENTTATAGNNIVAGSILHSHITAGNEIEVNGKRGFITGGHVTAINKIEAKTFGAQMGSPTIVEVGANPEVKQRYQALQKEIASLSGEISDAQVVLVDFAKRQAKGVKFTEERKKYVTEMALQTKQAKVLMDEMSDELRELQEKISIQNRAVILVTGMVYPGTKIIIGDVSMVVQSEYKYCRFEKSEGEVKMGAL